MALNGRQIGGLGKLVFENGQQLALVAVACLFAACSSGSDDAGGSPPPPAAPVANAGVNQTVQELTVVNLAGSATDANNDPITYSWMQTGGTAVTINTPDSASASFTAPNVAIGNPEVLTFELTASDPGGLSSTDLIDITVQETAVPVTISGTLRYEFPPPNNSCLGLNFGAIQQRPIRQATVQLLDETGTALIDSTVSDDSGMYSVSVDAGTNVMLRVLAETKRAGNLSWDVEIRNNVDTSANPPPLEQRPKYAMDSSVFGSGATNQTRNLTATTGWGGSSYTGPRVAAPFAILDAIYSAMTFVATEDPAANFPALDAFWSADNKSADPQDIDAGDLPTSFYNGQSQLFLLGTDGIDTEEFDDHVVVHEWGHYFEDNFSRSDNIGGSHFVRTDELDMRVAFGEGFATALAAMALGDPLYCDTGWNGSGNQTGFGIDAETGNPQSDGWYNELSLINLIYDLWDSNNDGADTSSIGFGPIYDVMTGPQATSPAFTSIFSFATYLKQQGTGQNAFIDAMLTSHDIVANGINIFGDGETNDGPGTPDDVLPIYTDITLGATTNICVNSQFDAGRDGNKLSEHRFLRLSIPSDQQVTFEMTANPAPSQPSPGFDCSADENDPENSEHSDPDFLVWKEGQLFWIGYDCDPNTEMSTTNGLLAAGDYVIDINDFRHEDEDSPAGYPEQVCFDFTAN